MTLPKLCLAISFVSFSLIGACDQSPPNAAKVAAPSLGAESIALKTIQNDAMPTVVSPTAIRVGNESPRSSEAVDERKLLRQSFSDCIDESEGITPEMQTCIEIEYEFQDARLQVAYGSVLKMQNATGRKIVEQSQAEWVLKRERDCIWDAQHEGQAQRLEANYCSMSSTAKRATDLEGILSVGK